MQDTLEKGGERKRKKERSREQQGSGNLSNTIARVKNKILQKIQRQPTASKGLSAKAGEEFFLNTTQNEEKGKRKISRVAGRKGLSGGK